MYKRIAALRNLEKLSRENPVRTSCKDHAVLLNDLLILKMKTCTKSTLKNHKYVQTLLRLSSVSLPYWTVVRMMTSYIIIEQTDLSD